ncbi:MAG: type 4a pilus biogenesis protein PilO [bacterium]
MNVKAINNRLASLTPAKKIVILISLIMLFGAFWNFVILRPKQVQMNKMTADLAKLQQELQEVQKVCKNYEAFQEEVEKFRQEFLLAQIQLPTEKEIPSLLTKISDLGSSVGLEFKLFKPQAEVERDFYRQLPIDIRVRGSYHNVAHFFQSISDLDRIVNIEDFTIGNPQLNGDRVTLETTCVATTYRFQAKAPEEKSNASSAKGKEGRKKK